MNLPSRRSGSAADTADRCSSPAETKILSTGPERRHRSKVCRIIGSEPASARNCFGRSLRLAGQKRVPDPPARMTWCRGSPLTGSASSLLRPAEVVVQAPELLLEDRVVREHLDQL